MAVSRLRNVLLAKSTYAGHLVWRLFDSEGDPIPAYDAFMRSNQVLYSRYETKRRYGLVAAHLVDYFFEINLIGPGAEGRQITRKEINEAIDYYLLLLRDGQAINLALVQNGQPEYADGDQKREAALRELAKRLQIKPLGKNSWDNTLAPINHFLRISEAMAAEEREMALHRGGIDHSIISQAVDFPMSLINAVTGSQQLSFAEQKAIKQNSVLGGCIRFRGKELRRPAGIPTPKFNEKRQVFDFPLKHIPALLAAATCWRDRALWLLEVGPGLRRHEALNMQWHQIDFEKRQVYVLEPEDGCIRFGAEMSRDERLRRFKGRAASIAYFMQPYRDWFFQALEQYRKHEYVVPADGNDYVFQYVRNPKKRGVPYREAWDSTFNDAFKGAVRRARIPGPPSHPDHVWTSQSLRHAFGVYMRNDYQMAGRAEPGLKETEIQMLMGHASVIQTRHYARTKPEKLIRALERSDVERLDSEIWQRLDQSDLPSAERIEDVLKRLGGKK